MGVVLSSRVLFGVMDLSAPLPGLCEAFVGDTARGANVEADFQRVSDVLQGCEVSRGNRLANVYELCWFPARIQQIKPAGNGQKMYRFTGLRPIERNKGVYVAS